MSQEKVNARKEYKKNRKQILAKEKRQKQASKAIAYLCGLVIVVGLGFSVYKKAAPEKPQDNSTFYNLIQTDRYGFLDPVISE
ncbi:MAG: hypothetical protein Q4E53_00580 [Eubacteriales bacterium]|nr:hypothetical protein [Eubacteriales bacterium]